MGVRRQIFSVLSEIFDNLERKTSVSTTKVTQNILDLISSFPNQNGESEEKDSIKIISFKKFTSEFDDAFNSHISNERMKCALNLLYILQYILIQSKETLENSEEPKDICPPRHQGDPNVQETSLNIFSLQELEIIEVCTRYILYTIYLSSLDQDAVGYLKMKIIQEKLIFGESLVNANSTSQAGVLRLTLKYLLLLFKDRNMGERLKKCFSPEILCGLLQLSFSPLAISQFPEDVPTFRQELEHFLHTSNSSHILKAIFLILGITAQKKGKSWLRNACQSLYVRRYLLKEGGVRLSLRAILSLGDTSDWRRKEAFASLIALAKCPNDIIFFEGVCPQILSLFQDLEKSLDAFQVLCLVVCQLARRSPKLAQMHLFGPLLSPLSGITEATFLSSDTSCHFTNVDLAPTVSLLYKFYVETCPPSGDLHLFLRPLLCPLTCVATLPPTCHVRSTAQLILVRYLSQLELEEIVQTLLVMSGVEDAKEIPRVRLDVKLVSVLNEVKIEPLSTESVDWVEIDERRIQALIEIINKLKMTSIVNELVRRLSLYLDFTVLNDIEIAPNLLLTQSDITDMKLKKFRKLSFVVGFLNAIFEYENFASHLFEDFASASTTVEALLKTHSQPCLDADLAQTRDSFLLSCTMLVLCCVNDKCVKGSMTSSDWRCLKGTVASLKEIKAKSTNEALLTFVDQLLKMALTHGAVGFEVDSKGLTTEEKPQKTQPLLSKTCLVSPTTSSVSSSSSSSTSSISSSTSVASTTPPSSIKPSPVAHSTSTTNSKSIPSFSSRPSNPSTTSCTHSPHLSSYQDSLMDACSPHLPIRGHALISFTKLLESGDEEAVRNCDKILSLFEHHLRDDDSYIYLASIEGMAALANTYPQKVVTLLTEEFSQSNQSIETRLKLIEILTKTTRRLGSMLPKYKNLFLNCLMNGVRDEDSLIKASCLSNLGEVCKELKFSVESVVQEIFALVDGVIQNDRSPEVKRAAVLFVTLLLQGLGKDSLKVLQTLMLDLYRSLKRLILYHNDPILVTQAELAMEEINTITREFLTPKMEMKKRIFVTEVPF